MSTVAWKIYRTRFLIKARQLTEPMFFVDPLGREQRGKPGDYLIESSDGRRSIQRREIFEDIYVAMGPAESSRVSVPGVVAAFTTECVGTAALGCPSQAKLGSN